MKLVEIVTTLSLKNFKWKITIKGYTKQDIAINTGLNSLNLPNSKEIIGEIIAMYESSYIKEGYKVKRNVEIASI